MIHGWWLERRYAITNVDFESARDSAGNAKFVQSGESGNFVKTGVIYRTVWIKAELFARTIGKTPPSSDLIGEIGLQKDKLIVGGPKGQEIEISPYAGSEWQQETSIETQLSDAILDAWEHRVTFRSGAKTITYGKWSEMDPPVIVTPEGGVAPAE